MVGGINTPGWSGFPNNVSFQALDRFYNKEGENRSY